MKKDTVLFLRAAEEKGTKKKAAVCTSEATPAGFPAKGQELTPFKQPVLFHAGKPASASRLYGEAGGHAAWLLGVTSFPWFQRNRLTFNLLL